MQRCIFFARYLKSETSLCWSVFDDTFSGREESESPVCNLCAQTISHDLIGSVFVFLSVCAASVTPTAAAAAASARCFSSVRVRFRLRSNAAKFARVIHRHRITSFWCLCVPRFFWRPQKRPAVVVCAVRWRCCCCYCKYTIRVLFLARRNGYIRLQRNSCNRRGTTYYGAHISYPIVRI